MEDPQLKNVASVPETQPGIKLGVFEIKHAISVNTTSHCDLHSRRTPMSRFLCIICICKHLAQVCQRPRSLFSMSEDIVNDSCSQACFAAQEYISAHGPPATYLITSAYYENYLRWYQFQKLADGTYTLSTNVGENLLPRTLWQTLEHLPQVPTNQAIISGII